MWETGLIVHFDYSKGITKGMNILVFPDINILLISGAADVDTTVSTLQKIGNILMIFNGIIASNKNKTVLVLAHYHSNSAGVLICLRYNLIPS